jgi:hypothetical protein
VRRFHAQYGRWPSRPKFDVWRREQPDQDQIPSSFKVAYAFGGSFKVAVTAASAGPRHDVTVRRFAERGPAYTRDELIEILRRCARDLDQDWMSYPVYLTWVEGQLRSDPRARVPRSRGSFDLRGGWQQLILAAGLRSAFIRESDGRLVDTAPGHCYSKVELIDALVEAAAALGVEMTGADYDQYRLGVLTCAAMEGRQVVFPARMAIMGQLGKWNDARFAAGLISEDQLKAGQRRRHRRIDVEVAHRQLAQILSERGEHLSEGDYRQWQATPEVRAWSDPPPSLAWWRVRYGSWTEAKNVVLGR